MNYLASPTSGVNAGSLGFLDFSFVSTPSEVINIYSSIKPALNQWSIAVLNVDGNKRTTRMFLNNVLVASSEIMPVIPTLTSTSTTPMFSIGNHMTLNWPFNGSIDEVRIYNRILNAAEISYLYSFYSAINKSNTTVNVKMGPNPCVNFIQVTCDQQ